MDDNEFLQLVRKGTGCAMIMAGSGSDESHIVKVVDSLNKFEVPHSVRILSAHKQPEEVMSIIRVYNDNEGMLAYIAIAGGTDALSGMLSFHTLAPVISCPPDENGLASALTSPPGSSNAVVPYPDNVGRHVAQMFAGVNPRYRDILREEIEGKLKSLREADARFMTDYGSRGR